MSRRPRLIEQRSHVGVAILGSDGFLAAAVLLQLRFSLPRPACREFLGTEGLHFAVKDFVATHDSCGRAVALGAVFQVACDDVANATAPCPPLRRILEQLWSSYGGRDA